MMNHDIFDSDLWALQVLLRSESSSTVGRRLGSVSVLSRQETISAKRPVFNLFPRKYIEAWPMGVLLYYSRLGHG